MSSKRIRSVNWDEDEKQLFSNVIKEHAKFIEDKTTDTKTNKMKSKAWEDIHKKFNELNRRQRELGQLKSYYRNRKVNGLKEDNNYTKESNNSHAGVEKFWVTNIIPIEDEEEIVAEGTYIMSSKRIRSANWDEDEKELFSNVIKEHAKIIEDKTTDTKTNKMKSKAWEDIHKKFNELNRRQRELGQLKTYYRNRKVDGLKEDNNYTKESNNSHAGVEKFWATNIIPIDDEEEEEEEEEEEIVAEKSLYKHSEAISTAKNGKIPKRVFVQDAAVKSKKEQGYTSVMINRSKILKDEELRRRLEMSEEEHAIKIKIYQEKLRSAILEREILELKKTHEENNVNYS